MPRLTKRRVESLPVRDKDYIEFDDEIPGFGVRVFPSGARSYLVQYRSGGRTRRVKIGKHGVVTADEARRKARELLGAVAKGDNPAQEISVHRGAPTVRSVGERFFREHAKERCKPSTQKEYRRALDLFIYPAIGAFKIVDVSRADIAALHHKHKDIPYQANRTLGVLSKLFTLCEVWGLRPDGSNPCRHVPKYAERKRERFLEKNELQRLEATLSAREEANLETPYIAAAFRLLVLTGCRLREIQTLRWDYIANGYLNLPDSKTGARRIPLSGEAQAVLDRLHRLPGNPYVIAGAVPGSYATDLQKPWRRIRKAASLEGVRIHDLRHTYASNAIGAGLGVPMVGKLLGHSQIQTTMRYAHLADSAVREAASLVSGSIGQSMHSTEREEGVSDPDISAPNVLAFPKRAQ